MTRQTRPYCYSCRRPMRSTATHLSTATHRAALARSLRETTGPRGSHAYSARKAGAARAYAALARWDEMYADDDPGNSPEWDAELAAL